MSRDDDLSGMVADAVFPLSTTDPAQDGDGLRAVGDRLAGHRVVALGEATHGTREFFELKHRVVRHLVEEHGFRLFGIEASFGETLAVNDYVHGGDGDLESVVGEMVFWTWDTEEVAALVQWLREFNDGRPHDEKVSFYGFDAQFAGASAERLDDYLARADPALHDQVADDLAALADDAFKGGDEDAVDEQIETATALSDVLADELDARRGALVDATSEREWRLARQHVTAIRQATDISATNRQAATEVSADGLEVRDRAMADNVDWILDHGPHDRIVLWAHNAHVKRGAIDFEETERPVTQMGGHLAEWYGDDYYALCFDFDRGGFQAIGDLTDAETGDRERDGESDAEERERGLREFQVASAPADSLAGTLAATGHSVAFLDVETASDDPVLADWLADDHQLRSVGATYDPDEAAEYVASIDLQSDLDGVLFVAETTRSRPLDE